jgi:hypothetical protein
MNLCNVAVASLCCQHQRRLLIKVPGRVGVRAACEQFSHHAQEAHLTRNGQCRSSGVGSGGTWVRFVLKQSLFSRRNIVKDWNRRKILLGRKIDVCQTL